MLRHFRSLLTDRLGSSAVRSRIVYITLNTDGNCRQFAGPINNRFWSKRPLLLHIHFATIFLP